MIRDRQTLAQPDPDHLGSANCVSSLEDRNTRGCPLVQIPDVPAKASACAGEVLSRSGDPPLVEAGYLRPRAFAICLVAADRGG